MSLRLYKSIYGKIFLSLWAVTAITLVAGFFLNWYFIIDSVRLAPQQSKPLMLQAAHVLDQQGEAGLRNWLRTLPETSLGPPVLILDGDGQELLRRAMPHSLSFELANTDAGAGRDAPSSLVPAQPLPTLVGRDGRRYGIYIQALHRPVLPAFRMQPFWHRAFVLILAIVLTLIASALLARSIARPVHALGHAARSLAGGALDTRVAASVPLRDDEIGALARDFDAMAARMQALVNSREQLLRDVSHELRSPLARMRLLLGIVRQADVDKHTTAARLDQELTRLDRLIGQVLSLTRLDASSAAPQMEPVELVEILETIVRDAEFEGQSRHIVVDWQCAHESVWMHGHPEWIASAVENVVRNALRYADAQTRVVIRLVQTADAVEVEVADEGPGVPAEALTKIFRPFFRVSVAHASAPSGDGIGLAIVERVMRIHGGTARAENRSGGGLLVTLRFPAAPSA
jgi:two-component system sensor histidine kinase CpxA